MTQLEHRRDHHPLLAKMAEIDAKLQTQDGERDVVGERKHELERQQKRLEDEVSLIAEKRTNIDGKLYGGEVTASKELLALQDEAAALLARQTEMEDEDLVIMEQVEEVDAELNTFAESRSALEAERTAHETELAIEVEQIEAELTELRSQRSAQAGPANAELLKRYEELRDQYGGVAVARLVGSSCDGCHMQLSAVAVDQIGKMPDDAVVTCEECGRLLVR